MLPAAPLIFYQLVLGLIMGLIYSLMAIGISLIFGVMKVVNFAHGELYMLGGYMFYYFIKIFDIPFIPSIFLLIIGTFIIGLVIEFLLLHPMFAKKMERPGEYSTIITFGLSIFLMNLALVVFGHHYKRPDDFVAGTITISFVVLPAGRIVASIASIFIILGVLAFIKRTWYGKALQATAQDRDGAALLGINTLLMNALAFGIASTLAASAGTLLAPVFALYPDAGVFPALKAYVITVLGGMGSIKGSIIGAVVLGLVESLGSAFITPAYRDVYGFIVLIIVLLVRPSGFFGERERRV